MKDYQAFLLSVLSIPLFIPTVSSATNNYPTTAPFPDVVHVRKNCETLADCGTTLAELQSWIDNYKRPSTTAPLLVDIGPGTFVGTITCNGYSNLSIKGAGQAQTVINGTFNPGYAIKGIDCTNLNVQDLTLSSTSSLLSPANWSGTGSSTWLNVDIEPVSLYAWTDSGCPSDPIQTPVHYWFSSHLKGLGKTYEAQCSKNWFFGSQIESIGQAGGGDVIAITVHAGNAPGSPFMPEVHVYGGNVAVTVSPGINYNSITAIGAGYNAMIHVHGTGIDIIGNSLPNNITALMASNGGFIHANGAAYNLSTGAGGTVTRISNSGGHIHAPYLWEHIPDPAVAPNFTSVNGADMTTVTTGTSDGQPHFVIYSANCASKWYDTTDKVCRP